MRTYAKILLNRGSWCGATYVLDFEFTGRIKYVKYPKTTKVFFEIKYIQSHTPDYSFFRDFRKKEFWQWVYKPVKTEIIEFLPDSKFAFDFEDEKITTIVECK